MLFRNNKVNDSAEVRKVQQQLINLGYLSHGQADGIFGGKTEQAVKKFQVDNGLLSDGIVGPATKSKLFKKEESYLPLSNTQWNQSMMRGFEGKSEDFQSDPWRPADFHIPSFSLNHVITQNEKTGLFEPKEEELSSYNKFNDYAQVKKIQGQLINLGYLSRGLDDGKFGPMTCQAVKEFQKNYGLLCDGIVGPATKSKLFSASMPQPSQEKPVFAKDFGVRSRKEGSQRFVLDEDNEKFFLGLAKRKAEYTLSLINELMQKYDINTEERVVHFIVQTLHEGANYTTFTEYGSREYFQKYEFKKNLGNNEPGDGYKYRGYGPIQLTGKYNFEQISKRMGNPDLFNDPEPFRLMKPENYRVAMETATAYWSWKNINELADEGFGEDTQAKIRKKINGGYNGLDDTKKRYKHYLSSNL